MPWNTAGLNAGAGGIAAAGAWISGHTADPGSTGTSEVAGGSPAYARKQTIWGAPSNTTSVGSQVTVDIPAATTLRWWGVWSASTGGTFLGGFQLSADEVFGAQGEWKHTPTIDLNPTA